MKKSLLFAFILCAAQIVSAAGFNTVVVSMKDGTSKNIHLTETSQITFTGTAIDFGGTSVNRANIVKFAYTFDSSVASINANAQKPFNKIGDELVFNTAANVALFSIDGRMITRQAVQSGSSLSISSLANGVYIVKVNNSSYKIAK
jgi:hypothetical protein